MEKLRLEIEYGTPNTTKYTTSRKFSRVVVVITTKEPTITRKTYYSSRIKAVIYPFFNHLTEKAPNPTVFKAFDRKIGRMTLAWS